MTDERWVVVDTETSGLDPVNDRLLAIGAVTVDGTGIRLDDSFEVVLRSDRASDKDNVVIHGIGHEAQSLGVPAADALACVLRRSSRMRPAWAFTANSTR